MLTDISGAPFNALLALCESPNVTPEQIEAILRTDDGIAEAQKKSDDSDLPFTALCRHSKVSAALLDAFLMYLPEASGFVGNGGTLPLHALCANPSATPACIRKVYEVNLRSLELPNARKEYPIHLVCDLDDGESCLRNLKCLLNLRTRIALRQDANGLRALDVLLRNRSAPTEAFEALFAKIPESIDRFLEERRRGVPSPYIDRLRWVLAELDQRRPANERPTLPPVVFQGPSPHMNLAGAKHPHRRRRHGPDERIRRHNPPNAKATTPVLSALPNRGFTYAQMLPHILRR
jgi:hypothetical protein